MLHRVGKLMAPEDSAGPGGTPPATPPEGAAPATPPVTPPESEVPANPSKADWKSYAVTQRKVLDALTAIADKLNGPPPAPKEEKTQTPATPAASLKPADEVAQLRAEMALRDALADAGVTNAQHRKALEKMWRQDHPADAGAWVTEQVAILGWAPKTAPAEAPKPIVPPIAPSNTGAPATPNGRAELPANPLEWPEEVAMKNQDAFMRALQAHHAAKSGFTQPWDDYHAKHGRGKSNGSPIDQIAHAVIAGLKPKG